MKILKAKFEQLDHRGSLQSGSTSSNGTITVLVDRIPKPSEFRFERIPAKEGQRLFYGKKGEEILYATLNGFVEIYIHSPGTTDGFGGRIISITFKDGHTEHFNGSLWHPWQRPENINPYYTFATTDNPDTFERGYTCFAMNFDELSTKEILELVPEAKAESRTDFFL